MGYHILIPESNSSSIYYYVENIEELAYIDDITEDTIVYEGPKSQMPWRLM
ncbi:hypothetical protein SAMN05428988_1656 [Chitinophaga sp. YR573]|nr:hypothetical protein SAMN05428988_1656 [Chitinophaga sp. YR573]